MSVRDIHLLGSPVLREQATPVGAVDGEVQQLVRDLFDTMHADSGIGLAANQVNLPLRLFVVNLASDPNEGEELVFLNPVISRPKGSEEAEEGCLSLPGVYGNVMRSRQIRVNAFTLQGEEIAVDLEGLMARVFQHELDHLDGVLFPDRMSSTGQLSVKPALDEFTSRFQRQREAGHVGSDEEILAELREWEQRYC